MALVPLGNSSMQYCSYLRVGTVGGGGQSGGAKAGERVGTGAAQQGLPACLRMRPGVATCLPPPHTSGNTAAQAGGGPPPLGARDGRLRRLYAVHLVVCAVRQRLRGRAHRLLGHLALVHVAGGLVEVRVGGQAGHHAQHGAGGKLCGGGAAGVRACVGGCVGGGTGGVGVRQGGQGSGAGFGERGT